MCPQHTSDAWNIHALRAWDSPLLRIQCRVAERERKLHGSIGYPLPCNRTRKRGCTNFDNALQQLHDVKLNHIFIGTSPINRPVHKPFSSSATDLCRNIFQICFANWLVATPTPTWDMHRKLIGCSFVAKEWRRIASMYEALWTVLFLRKS